MRACHECGNPCLPTNRFCPACGADLASAPARGGREQEESLVGTTIGGKFVLKKMVGSGGMGKVYRADHKGVGRTVAVKIMHPHLVGDNTASARFTNEARAASQLNHPNSISVLDFGQTESGVLYIVMEYLDGRALDHVLRDEYPLAFGRVAHIMCQTLDAVQAAHDLSIIHRDLKPENILLVQRKSGLDFIKVLDFGIAKMLDLEDRSVTTPGLVPGTPEYMSPEQARGEKLDSRSDVYSAGVIFYELLTNVVPFQGSSAVATMMSHVQDPPVPPSQRAPERGIPPALEAISMWGLAKNADERLPSARQFRDVLSAWAQVAGVWPQADGRASSPDVLLDIFSEDELQAFPLQLTSVDRETRGGAERVVVPKPRGAAATVGRETELERLQALVRAVGPRVLRICGEAGLGKTRLVHAMIKDARANGLRTLVMTAAPGWTPRTLGPAREAAAACLDLDTRQAAEREMLLSAASQAGLDSDAIPGLSELFGVTGHASALQRESRKRERAAAFCHVIYRSAASQPLLLVFEDFERYDQATRELVIALARAPREQLTIVITHEPDATIQWPAEAQLLELRPLDSQASEQMLRSLFDAPLDADLVEQAVPAVGGHPLFIEQLAFALRYERLSQALDRVADLVAGRLDALPQSDREILQVMAAIRRPVSREQLSTVVRRDATAAELNSLVTRGFLKREDERYAFSHDRVALFIYASIPAEVRREIHHHIADQMRGGTSRISEIAFHAYEADDGPKAVEELDRAGTAAELAMDIRGATRSYTRAIELVRREWGRGRIPAAELDSIVVDLAQRLAGVLREDGDIAAAQGTLEEVLSVAGGRDDARANLRLALGRIDLERGNHQRALRRLELARLDADGANSDWLRGEVLRELARAKALLGDKEAAGQLLTEALNTTARVGTLRGRARCSVLTQAATIALQLGEAERSKCYLADALAQAEQASSAVAKLPVLQELASMYQSLSEWPMAQEHLEQSVELAARAGDRTTEAALLIDLGRVYRVQGAFERAQSSLSEAVSLCRNIAWWDGIKRAEQEADLLRYAAPQAGTG